MLFEKCVCWISHCTLNIEVHVEYSNPRAFHLHYWSSTQLLFHVYSRTGKTNDNAIRSRSFKRCLNLCEQESANEDQLFAQTLWYLLLAANSQLFLLYPSLILFTCLLMPLSLQTNPRDCDHILVFISIKTPSRAISGL